jgi:molecular chaperone GrpE
MADEQNHDEEPVIRDKRKIDPETGDVREPATDGAADDAAPPVDGPNADGNAGDANTADAGTPLTPEDQLLLDQASADLVAEMRSDMLRAQAELVNFRTRVERDRQANRDAVIAEVIRALLPTLDDLDRAEAHGDLVEGAPLTLVAQKLRGSFDKFGLARVGEKGDAFDPAFHEAVVQIPTPEATSNTIADVIQPGYTLGERLVRPAKVAVSVPAE